MKMKMNMNIKPTYIAAIAVVVCVATGTFVTTNSIDSAENVLVAQLAEQKAIIDQYNKDSQEKLDGLKSDLGTLNDNDKVLFELINEQGLILGLMQEDILAFKESIKNLDDAVRANHEFIIGELGGIKKTVDALRNAGNGKVTAQQVIRYNTCMVNGSNCNWILSGN
jgi:hypothetical protein